ncbi:MAG: hypothetical protein DRH21_07755 [Deltaproteobacteria bacterium]|nr:MAG: hypothetical protein DRH21_07755 [Deltaproteobacteria bacterium]
MPGSRPIRITFHPKSLNERKRNNPLKPQKACFKGQKRKKSRKGCIIKKSSLKGCTAVFTADLSQSLTDDFSALFSAAGQRKISSV